VIVTVIVPAGSAVEYQRHERCIGKDSKEAAVPFFFFELTICASPGVTEEDHTSPLVSRCSGCNLEKIPQYKSGESHLGYYSISGFLVLEILAAGRKLFL
jgi:hypothetical protein